MCDFFLPVTVTSLKREIGFHIISWNTLNLYQHRTWHTLFFVCQTDIIYDSELSRKETIMMYLMIEDDNPGNMIYWKVPTNWIAADSYLRTAQPPTVLGNTCWGEKGTTSRQIDCRWSAMTMKTRTPNSWQLKGWNRVSMPVLTIWDIYNWDHLSNHEFHATNHSEMCEFPRKLCPYPWYPRGIER